MPWQNVRKWLEEEIETKDKDGNSESLAEKLRAQISSDDFAEEMAESDEKTEVTNKSTAKKDETPEASANIAGDKSTKQDSEKSEAAEKTNKSEKPQEGSSSMSTASPAMPDPITYGIVEATELMRGLPEDHIELVALVVKRTLESTNVKVSTIIEDATRKQKRIDDRISLLKNEIQKFEEEIALRKGEISTLENEGEEITTVKERLKLAEQLSIKETADKGSAADSTGTAKTGTEKPKKPAVKR